jgi:hypothetical protein
MIRGGVMLITFKSKAAAEVMMYEEHARRILDLLNKDVKRGIITSEETPAAVARLEQEIAESRMHPPSEGEVKRDVLAHHVEEEEGDHEPVEFVSFATRAYPLLEMLRAARNEGREVMWGV